MSSFGGGDVSSLGDLSGSLGSNSYDFSSGLGSIDSGTGLNDLNAGLMGAGAGTTPNGFLAGASNYVPNDSGISSGALNGDTSFSMPANSMGQLNAQSLGSALGMGSKLAGAQPTANSGRQATGSGKVSMHQVQFANPIQNFAGSLGGSQAGNALLQLLAKYHPGSGQ